MLWMGDPEQLHAPGQFSHDPAAQVSQHFSQAGATLPAHAG
jgi:hypothetical protein